MLQSLHEGDGVITFTLQWCLRATVTANMPEWLHEAGRVTYGTFLVKGNVADFWQALHGGRRARQSVPKAAYLADQSKENWITFCDARRTCMLLGVRI
jgi:hypothetical protein